MKNFLTNKRGISIIEIIVVLAVLGLIIAVAIPRFSYMREKQVLKAGVADILSAMDKARVATTSSLNSSEYGVHFQSDQVIIFKGRTFAAGTSTNESISLTTPATITNVTLGGVSASSGDIYFSRIYGAPSTTGTLTLSTNSLSKTITIQASGSASSN